MSQRSSEEVCRILGPRKESNYFGGEDSDGEVDAVEEQESDNSVIGVSDSESKQSDEDQGGETEDEQPSGGPREYAYGDDGHKWCLQAPESLGRGSNLTAIAPRVIGTAADSRTPLEVWSSLFTNDILETILKHTNAEIERRTSNNHKIASHRPITMNELKAYIGLLYHLGASQSNRVCLSELWSHDFGSMLCKVTMAQRRFEFISCRIRFDDKDTRAERRVDDVLAPIREIWKAFVTNCRKNYSPSEFLTIDEQLLEFRGRYSARVCVKSKPPRYGIKIVSMNDAKTFYMFNAVPYTGRATTESGESASAYYVRKLSEPIYNTARNVTCGNSFSSIEIFNRMKRDYNLSMVGSLRKNELQIPNSFKRNASTGTTRYGYDDNNILLSYCPKKNKVVLLLSSKHESGKKCQDNGKPEMIDFYDKTKCGTVGFDQLCANYTCVRPTNRWTMRFFLAMLDHASVNSCILYNFSSENDSRNKREFLKDLVLSLIKPHLEERAKQPGLQKVLSENIREVLSGTGLRNSDVQVGEQKMNKRKRCHYCPNERDRKTNYCCVKCKKPTCDDHRISCCVVCFL